MEQSDRLLLRSSPTKDTTPEMGIILGHALSLDYKTVIIGMDMMKSSPMMRDALVSSLISSGTDVIDMGVVPCPALAMAASKGDCAVYITEFRQDDLVSGYLLLNPDGSLFEKEQIRRLDRVFRESHEMPDYKNLGTVNKHFSAVDEYNRRVMSLFKDADGGTVVFNCNCGTTSGSAPQILNGTGSDVISLNAQYDRNFASNSLSTTESGNHHIKTFISASKGSIGISMNRIGTLFKVFDEDGDILTDTEVLALLIMYMRPRKIVLPMDISGLIVDIFTGMVTSSISTPYDEPLPEDMDLIMVRPDGGSVCKAIKDHEAEIGYYDGGFIFGDLSLMSDVIYASAIISHISGRNNISNLVSSLPQYYSERKTYKFNCTPEDFIRMMNANIPDIESTRIVEDEGWRIEMSGGWFYVALDEDQENTVNIIAESADKAYLIGIIEVVDKLISKCENGQ